MVIGRNLLHALRIMIDFRDQTVQWKEQCAKETLGTLMRPRPDSKCVEKSKEMADSAAILKNLLRDANVSRYYLDLLKTNCHLYDAHLRRMRFDDYLLQLSPDYEPVHAKPYPILRSLNNSAKAEIQRHWNRLVTSKWLV